MIRPVYQAMTIHTGFAQQAHRPITPAGQARCAINLTGMIGIGMTVLTQIGRANLEEICVRRAVRIVASGTIFTHGGVLP